MITVIYDARVYVDVEDGHVTRVVIDDEGTQLDRDGTRAMNDDPQAALDEAIKTAENGEWPAWDFGS